jgi:hypothetical protein
MNILLTYRDALNLTVYFEFTLPTGREGQL